ncbi:uncharacterized protein LOC123559081 [Mercenaria mercenaria]|uniref:uncharacterized protein LOC123559081 n=1 Tax=Mercenaria mercenaria TaxID=6596 RepID=UPI00234F1EA3|nr:uncharacterized protein LOC123559081 [Mercenaria mercenaria]
MFSRNGFVMYSRSCTKVNKHNSYTIAIDDGQNSSIEVDSFLVHEQTRRVFAVGKLFGEDGCAVEGRVPHIKLLKRRMDLAVVKAELLREPLVVIKNGENISASCFPNTYERD